MKPIANTGKAHNLRDFYQVHLTALARCLSWTLDNEQVRLLTLAGIKVFRQHRDKDGAMSVVPYRGSPLVQTGDVAWTMFCA